MSTYTATARRDGRWWVIQCDQHPGAISQVSNLNDAASVHREAIAFVTGEPLAEVTVEVLPAVPEPIRDRIRNGRHLQQAGNEQLIRARTELRTAAVELRAEGWTLRDIAHQLGMSHQRVHQLLADQNTVDRLPRDHDATYDGHLAPLDDATAATPVR